MKLAFISYPYASDPVANCATVKRICRHIADTEPDVLPVAPHLALSFYEETDRARVMAACVELLAGCDELRLYGPVLSPGMAIEADAAQHLGISVVNRLVPKCLTRFYLWCFALLGAAAVASWCMVIILAWRATL